MPPLEQPPVAIATGRTAVPAMGDVDRVVHEPARLGILSYLYVVESADFTFLLHQTGLTWGNLSAHIAKLEQAGYVEVVKQFIGKKPNSMLRLTDPGRAALRAYARTMRLALDSLPE